MVNLSDSLGKPRKYKELSVYPIKIKECEEFYQAVECLIIPKNTIQDIKILRMSYLAFLDYLIEDEYKVQSYSIIEYKLGKLLSMVLKSDNIKIFKDDKNRPFLVVDDEQIVREKDFDNIKKIIGEQNLLDLDDEFMNPEVKKRIDEAKEFMRKMSSGKIAELDQQIIAYHCVSKTPYRDIEELTLYQFRKGLDRFELIKQSDAILNARYSGMVEFKDESNLPHWLNKIEERDKNDGLLLDAEQFKKKANDILGSGRNA